MSRRKNSIWENDKMKNKHINKKSTTYPHFLEFGEGGMHVDPYVYRVQRFFSERPLTQEKHNKAGMKRTSEEAMLKIMEKRTVAIANNMITKATETSNSRRGIIINASSQFMTGKI